ncbi:MAG: hypothetical protein K2W82_17705 [Candidatus Obscuribacterales bacterium]|nr:hypothetical protein [Candidatus Obscuribacterales bacterium]
MNYATVLKEIFGVLFGTLLLFVLLADSNPAVAIAVLVTGLIIVSITACSLPENKPAFERKSWDHFGRDIEALATSPSTIGDKVQVLRDLYAAVVYKHDYRNHWAVSLRSSLSRIESLLAAGLYDEANKVADAEIKRAVAPLVTPRQAMVATRLQREAAEQAKLALVEFTDESDLSFLWTFIPSFMKRLNNV